MDKFLDRIGIDEYSFLRIIKFLILSFVLINISSFLMYSFGSSYFALDYNDSELLNNISSHIFLYFNLTIFSGMVFKIYDKNIFKIGLIYYLLYIIVYNITTYFYFLNFITEYISFISPIIFVIIYSQYKKCHSFKVYARFIACCTLIILFQLLEIQYRELFNGFVNYNLETDYINKLTIAVNNLILQFLIYILLYIKDVNNYGYQFILFTNAKSDVNIIQKQNEVDQETLQEIENMSKKDRFLFLTFVAVVQLIQFLIISITCILGSGTDGFTKLILTLIGFWGIRSILGKSFHFDDILHCTIFSALIFLIATKLSPHTNLSAFMPVIMGGLVAFSLYHLKIHFDKYKNLKDRLGDMDVVEIKE